MGMPYFVLIVSMLLSVPALAAQPKGPPPAQPAFTPAEAWSFAGRWMCDHYGTDPDDNVMLSERPKGPRVPIYPVDAARGALIGVNADDGEMEQGARRPVRELVWVKSVREMAQPIGGLVELSYLPEPTLCVRGACLFTFPNLSRVWFALRRVKKKELIVGLFPVQAETEPQSDALFTRWLDGIDAVFGVATPPGAPNR
ncbi:MAG: hypothetical protein KC635_08060 [Myxococcales bacterium]|nr:hypothetical protein [Myxococcales bacterium]